MVHDEPSSLPVGPLPGRAAGVPRDLRNSAPRTRANYRFQDHCAALIILRHLSSESLEGVLVERAADLALIPRDGLPELISIKHREVSQQHAASWSLGELAKQVLGDLYRYWVESDRQCRVTFSTNAGFHSKAHEIEKVCRGERAHGDGILRRAAFELSKALRIRRPEAGQFLRALTLDGGRPDRHHIVDVGTAAMKDLVERFRPGPITSAEACYDELLCILEERSSDRPASDIDAHGEVPATVADLLRERERIRQDRQYLDAKELLQHLLLVHDRVSVTHLVDRAPSSWQGDPNFVGRDDELAAIEQFLQPGTASEVAPLVIYGIPGCGKTALATQYASQRSDRFRPVLLNGESRSSVAAGLQLLRQTYHRPSDRTDDGIAEVRGRVTVSLPPTSALLLIIDGVTDPEATAGLIPTESLCRVIITATGSHVASAGNALELDTWHRDESLRYLQQVLPDLDNQSAAVLADTLHDHPLALAQAASFCKTSNRTADEFLRLYAHHPTRMLEQNPAPGHPAFITTTTRMLLECAAQQHPRAVDLAKALSLLAREPITESTLSAPLVFAHIAAPTRASRRRRKILKWAERFGLYRYDAVAELNAVYPAKARPIAEALSDELTRIRAIDTLVQLSLVKRGPTGLQMHPLVALVIGAQIKDKATYLAVAFSWFAEGATDLESLQFHRIREHITHLHTLTSTALDLDLRGPAIFGSCYLLAINVPQLPRGTMSQAGEAGKWSLTDIAIEGVRIAHENLEWANYAVKHYWSMRIALAGVFAHQGEFELAIHGYQDVLEAGIRYAMQEVVASALVNLGTLAADSRRRDLREKVAEILSRLPTSENIMMQVSIAHATMRQLHTDGKVQEALDLCQETIELLDADPGNNVALKDLVHSEAATFARDLGDHESTYEHERLVLQIRTHQHGVNPQKRVIEALCSTADAAMSVHQLREAEQLLDRAEALVSEGFQHDADLRQSLLSARGHLLVDKGKYPAARKILEEAIALELDRGTSRHGRGLAADFYNLAVAQRSIGQLTDAVASAERALQLDLEWFTADHPQAVLDYTHVANMRAAEAGGDNMSQAMQFCEERAISRGERALFAHNPLNDNWWGGGILGENSNPTTSNEAYAWAYDVLHKTDRSVIASTRADDHALITVLNPIGLVVLHPRESGWILAEIWVLGGLYDKLGEMPLITSANQIP